MWRIPNVALVEVSLKIPSGGRRTDDYNEGK